MSWWLWVIIVVVLAVVVLPLVLALPDLRRYQRIRKM
jgi:hypothetical protein